MGLVRRRGYRSQLPLNRITRNSLRGPIKPQVLEAEQKDACTGSLVRYSVTANRTTDAFLLIPDNLTGPAPAVIAIHDHGGFYYSTWLSRAKVPGTIFHGSRAILVVSPWAVSLFAIVSVSESHFSFSSVR